MSSGILVLGFEQSWATPLTAILTAIGVSMILDWLDAWARGRRDALSREPRRFPEFPAGLPDSRFCLRHVALCQRAALARDLRRRSVDGLEGDAARAGRQRTLRSTSSIPRTSASQPRSCSFPQVGFAPPYHFTENVRGLWDWGLPGAVLITGVIIHALFTGRLPLVGAWLGGFVLQGVFRAWFFGTPLFVPLMPMTSAAFILFTLYMIPDPATTPLKPCAPGGVRFRRRDGLWHPAIAAHRLRAVLRACRGLCSARAFAAHLVTLERIRRQRRTRARRTPRARRVARAKLNPTMHETPDAVKHTIAVVGMACVYPEANSPAELWENVLAQRRSFRRLPPERLRLENFFSEDREAEDSTYATQAAVIADYHFDRDEFRIAESTYHSTDLAHWLALDVATRALVDAGFADAEGLPRESTGVILGNTLTGEFSRANVLRLRWHYVRAAAEHAWAEAGLPVKSRAEFFRRYEARFKAPFPPIDADTLAGGLANTIAGRICNYHDLQGGGYTVDGACASSLLAVAQACSALVAGDLEVALAGGVDLSLDPFELVGFAKVGALAPDEMRVFDVRSQGFWPGEGCGFLVLMPHHRALEQGRRIYATIRGWGISSDGHGGLTRPELDGQVLALQRAYRRAGFEAEAVGYFEGHGTGTVVGDATELRAISTVRRDSTSPAAIGSIKANIGHTKAAAGVAGLLKAILAVHHGVLPPTTGCEEPQETLCKPSSPLRVLREAQSWPNEAPRRAAASAMGFGGINSHIVIEGIGHGNGSSRPRDRTATAQDVELFLFATESNDALLAQVERVRAFAAQLSYGELTDLAVQLEGAFARGGHRAALVASTPAELANRLKTLALWLREGVNARLDTTGGIFLGEPRSESRIGFLFPGQAAPIYRSGGIFARRFEAVHQLYESVHLPICEHAHSTAIAQPAVAAASAAGLRVLADLGIEARVAVGHSLGEITGLHWAGAIDESTLLAIAAERGRAMADIEGPEGTMAAIEADADAVTELIAVDAVHIVGLNSPRQTVISGEVRDVPDNHRARTRPRLARRGASSVACVSHSARRGRHAGTRGSPCTAIVKSTALSADLDGYRRSARATGGFA